MAAINKVGSLSPTSAPTAVRKHVVIVGATGMFGGYALRHVLENSAVGTVTAIGRKKLGGTSQAKLKSSYVETSRTAPAGRGALGTGRCSLLPWYLYGDSVGGGAPEDNRGLHHRVARVLRNTAVLTQASHS